MNKKLICLMLKKNHARDKYLSCDGNLKNKCRRNKINAAGALFIPRNPVLKLIKKAT